MDWIFHQLSQSTVESRLWALSSLLLVAGTGFFPIPLDMFLAVLGIMVAKGALPYFGTVVICLLVLLVCDIAAFELGKLFAEQVLKSPKVVRWFGQHRIEGIQERLKKSEMKIARTLRFNVIMKPYFILFSSALGLSRKLFYTVHLSITFVYIPLLIAVMANISQYTPIKDWQIVCTFWAIWIISVLIPSRHIKQ